MEIEYSPVNNSPFLRRGTDPYTVDIGDQYRAVYKSVKTKTRGTKWVIALYQDDDLVADDQRDNMSQELIEIETLAFAVRNMEEQMQVIENHKDKAQEYLLRMDSPF